jgi:hypothetical protein
MRTPSIAAGISAANELSAHSSHSRTHKCAHVCTLMCPHRNRALINREATGSSAAGFTGKGLSSLLHPWLSCDTTSSHGSVH